MNPLKSLLFLLVTLLALEITSDAAVLSWEKPSQPPFTSEPISLVSDPRNPAKVLIASAHQIYEETQEGNWKHLWEIQGTQNKIRKLLYFKEIPDALFVLTQDGVFKGDLLRSHWEKIYDGKSSEGRSPLSFAILPEDPDHWLVGTEDGLYESDDAGKTWFRFSQFSEHQSIPVIAFAGNRLLIAAKNRIFVSEDLLHFKMIFSLPLATLEEPLEDETEEFSQEALSSRSSFYALISSDERGRFLWLGTAKGVFESRDGGKNWSLLPSSGLREIAVEHLVYAQRLNKLVAGTSKGIYVFDSNKGHWDEKFQGLAQPQIFGIAILEAEKDWLVASTQDGFMRYPLIPEEMLPPEIWIPSPERMKLFSELIRMEPTAREVHQAVIRYGNLSQWKIRRWQAESRLAALAPSLSFGRDFSRRNNIDVDRADVITPDEFIDGPDDTTESWDMNVSWDFGDFLWSSNQTSIDSREKLMVELRNDLLSEATRIYHERRRLEMDIAFSLPPSEREHFEKMIRLDELTSLLDGMTDGFMSQRLARIYSDRPELYQLWQYSERTV